MKKYKRFLLIMVLMQFIGTLFITPLEAKSKYNGKSYVKAGKFKSKPKLKPKPKTKIVNNKTVNIHKNESSFLKDVASTATGVIVGQAIIGAFSGHDKHEVEKVEEKSQFGDVNKMDSDELEKKESIQ